MQCGKSFRDRPLSSRSPQHLQGRATIALRCRFEPLLAELDHLRQVFVEPVQSLRDAVYHPHIQHLLERVR